jgi:hypothetical protein
VVLPGRSALEDRDLFRLDVETHVIDRDKMACLAHEALGYVVSEIIFIYDLMAASIDVAARQQGMMVAI